MKKIDWTLLWILALAFAGTFFDKPFVGMLMMALFVPTYVGKILIDHYKDES